MRCVVDSGLGVLGPGSGLNEHLGPQGLFKTTKIYVLITNIFCHWGFCTESYSCGIHCLKKGLFLQIMSVTNASRHA